MTTLFLMVGLPGSGKTTKAKEIERNESAIRFTPDDWIIEKYGNNLSPKKHDEVRDKIEKLFWNNTKELLKSGKSVILDYGFWGKSERDEKRREAKKLGAEIKIIFLEASIDELWERASSRPETKEGTLHFTRGDLEKWSKTFQPPGPEELN